MIMKATKDTYPQTWSMDGIIIIINNHEELEDWFNSLAGGEAPDEEKRTPIVERIS